MQNQYPLPAAPFTFKLTVNGSDLGCDVTNDGSDEVTSSDPGGITGNVRGGLWGFHVAVDFDNPVYEDIGGGPAPAFAFAMWMGIQPR